MLEEINKEINGIKKFINWVKQLFFSALNDYKDTSLTLKCSYSKTLVTGIIASCYLFFLSVLLGAPGIPVFTWWIVWGGFFIVIAKLFRFLSCKDFFQHCYSCSLPVYAITTVTFTLYVILLIVYGLRQSPDTIWQWEQVLQASFDDWHPVIHTYSIYLLSNICKSGWFVAVCFISFFAILCGWLTASMKLYSYPCGIIWGVMLLIISSPVNLYAFRILLKDTAFLVAVFYISICMLHLWHTQGQWLLKIQHCVPLFLIVFYASFVRHNGIFFTIPFLFFLPILAKKTKIRRFLFIFSILSLLSLGGYFHLRNVMLHHNIIHQKTKQGLVESVGLPMSMILQAYVFTPDKLSPDTIAFIRKIFPEKTLYHYPGDFNFVKFQAIDKILNDFQHVSVKDFAKIFRDVLINCPIPACSALLYVTEVAWNPFFTMRINVGFCDDLYYSEILRKTKFACIWQSPGLYICLLIIAGLFSYLKYGWKFLPLVSPFVAYTYGTALLLSGHDLRFFWAITASAPIIIIALISGIYSSEQTVSCACEDNSN